MTEYKIIEEEFSDHDKCSSLIKEIRASIYDGWQPVGDVCISCDGETTWIAQSMIKKSGTIIDYVIIRGYVDTSMHTLVEKYLVKGYEVYGNLQSVGNGEYYQVLIKRNIL